MKANDIPPMAPELWIANILEVAGSIADKEYQERRWLAPDAHAWECPDELICNVDDVVLDGFLDGYASTFSDEQRIAAFGFRDALNKYCQLTPQHLDAAETLADPRWNAVRQRAAAFVAAFTEKWPLPKNV
jgi:hypothetical protein